MRLIKDLLNNILLLDGINTVQKWSDVATELILNVDMVIVRQTGVPDYAMFPQDIESYQVLPALSVHFSGSASALMDVLKDNLFSSATTSIVIGGGDAADVTYDNSVSGLAATDVQAAIDELAAGSGIDTPYAPAQWHSFTENYDSTTTRSLDANFFIGYQVLIKKEVTISDLAVRYTAGIAGDCVVGVYSTAASGHPDTKLFQSAAAFNNASAGVQQVSLLGGNAVLPAGLYWVLYLSSSTPTAAALNQNTFINTSGWNSAMNAPNNVWFRALAYTATLPNTAGAGALGNNGAAIPFFTFLTV